MQFKKIGVLIVFLGLIPAIYAQQPITLSSPDGNLQLELTHHQSGEVLYSLNYNNKKAIELSGLGFEFKEPQVSLTKFELLGVDTTLVSDSWQPVWGEVKTIENNYKQLVLRLADKSGSGILLNIIFKI